MTSQIGILSVTLIPSLANPPTAPTSNAPTSSSADKIKPIRKARPSNNNSQSQLSQQWSSSKCLRHLRSFTSKISALKTFVQSTPSALAASSSSVSTANSSSTLTISESLFASSATGLGAGIRRTSGELRGGTSEYWYGRRNDEEYRPESGMAGAARKRAGARGPVRTYGGGAGSLTRTNSSHGYNEASTTCSGVTAGKTKDGSNINNGSNSLIHLMLQKESLNRNLFSLYLSIYHSLAQLLQSTQIQSKTQAEVPSSTSKIPPVSIGAPSLVRIATHALAHCIIATSPTENPNSTLLNYNQTNREQKPNNKQEEIPQSDWYDGVEEVSSSYLPSLLRFHAIEVIAQSVRTRGVDCNLGSLLAGLCFEMGAMHEGEVIVRELLDQDERKGMGCIYVYLISPDREKNPGFAERGWRILKEYISGKLSVVGLEVLASMLGGVGNRAWREKAWKDWMHGGIAEARDFVLEVMRVGFGLWGMAARDDVRMRMCRMDRLKRNGITLHSQRGSTGVSMAAVRKIRKLVYGNNTLNKTPAKKIEDIVLEFLDTISKTALGLDPEILPTRVNEAKIILWDLVEGFLEQSGEVRNVLETVWGGGEIGGGKMREKGFYPKDSKVLVLLFALVGLEGQHNEDKKQAVSQEIARVIDEEKYAAIAAANEAVKNTASSHSNSSSITDDSFMEKLVDHLIDFYGYDGMNTELGHQGIQRQVNVLLDIAFPPRVRHTSSVVGTTTVPVTPGPKTPAVKKLTWTPAVNNLSPEDEATSIRYYMSRLALMLGRRFSSLPETKYSEYWVEWVEGIEQKVLCMPIPTPARKPAHHQRRRRAPEERTLKISAKKPKSGALGWKFEEGLGAWVARTGKTPARNPVLGGMLGGAVRRSTRLGLTDEGGGIEVGGRRWVFGGVVLSPMGIKTKDAYELFVCSESEKSEESEADEEEAMGITEEEDSAELDLDITHEDEKEKEKLMGNNDNRGREVTDDDDNSRLPASPIIIKKKHSSKYVHPTSASSLSSEGESEYEAEPKLILPSSLCSSRLIPPPSVPRRKACSPQKPTKSVRSHTAYRSIKEHQQRRRQSTRAAALTPKHYDVDGSSSLEEDDAYTDVDESTPLTNVTMLSSPPPEDRTISKHRPRRISAEKKQLSLLDILGVSDSSPVHPSRRSSLNGAGKKRKATSSILDLPETSRSLRKRVRREDWLGGEEQVMDEQSPSEADDEFDEDYVVGSLRKKRVAATTTPAPARDVVKKDIVAPSVKSMNTGHDDVFLDGNRWDLRARNPKLDNPSPLLPLPAPATKETTGGGVYSSPPESSRSEGEDEDDEMDEFYSEEEKDDSADEEFTLVSPPASHAARGRGLQKQQHPISRIQNQPQRQLRQTSRSVHDLSSTSFFSSSSHHHHHQQKEYKQQQGKGIQKRKNMTKAKKGSNIRRGSSISSSSTSSTSSSGQTSLKKTWATTKEIVVGMNEISGPAAAVKEGRRCSGRGASGLGGAKGVGENEKQVERRAKSYVSVEVPDEDELSEDELCF